MVVQLSLLTSIFGIASLASAIVEVFEKELDSRPPEIEHRPLPSEEGIRSVLRSCQEQTANFDWSLTLLAVAHKLNLPDEALSHPLPNVLLRGLVYMLPLTQSLPENRLIHIEAAKPDFICPVIAWAHHIGSLTVTVINEVEPYKGVTTFGEGPAEVVISIKPAKGFADTTSITLLESTSTSQKDPIITFASDPDEFKVEAVRRRFVQSYGNAAFARLLADIPAGGDALLEEMAFITTSLAITVSRYLTKQPDVSLSDPSVERQEQSNAVSVTAGYDTLGSELQTSLSRPGSHDKRGKLECSDTPGDSDIRKHPTRLISDQSILRAARFIFGTKNLEIKALRGYIDEYGGCSWVSLLRKPPRRIETVLTQSAGLPDMEFRDVWKDLLEAARHLAVLIMALAHVEDLETCAELPISFDLKLLANHPLSQNILRWNGETLISIDEMTWFNVMAFLLMGRDHQRPTACLLSDHGWTIFLNTFDQPSEIDMPQMRDPATVLPGFFFVRRGVPTRNLVVKHAIFDGPTYTGFDNRSLRIFEMAGDSATLRCCEMYSYGRTFYGERQDSFLITLRLALEKDISQAYTRRTGYFELFHSIWNLRRTQSCHHPIAEDEKSAVKLGPGYVAVSSASDNGADDFSFSGGRVLIALTANNQATRWRTLIAIAQARQRLSSPPGVLLRTHDCCFQCAIDQIAAEVGKWWLVL